MFPAAPVVSSEFWQNLWEFTKAGCRGCSWLIEKFWSIAVFNTFIGIFTLFLILGGTYWIYLALRGRHFLVIAPFRIWAASPALFLSEGLASRLRDEIARLHLEAGQLERGRGLALFHDVPPPIPPQLSLQYAGISPEVAVSFLRRICGREIVVTGDLCPHGDGLLLVARHSSGTTLWEVAVVNSYDAALREGLQELAVRVVIDGASRNCRYSVADALLARQLKAMEQENYDEALRQAKLGVLAVPDHHIEYFNLGFAYAGKKQYDEAIAAYDRALSLDPPDSQIADVLTNRGIAHGEKGETAKAVEDCGAAVRKAGGRADLWFNYARALKLHGQIGEAEQAYAEAKRLESQPPVPSSPAPASRVARIKALAARLFWKR
jgi:tetratricopeptide (TPR) repeat protein